MLQNLFIKQIYFFKPLKSKKDQILKTKTLNHRKQKFTSIFCDSTSAEIFLQIKLMIFILKNNLQNKREFFLLIISCMIIGLKRLVFPVVTKKYLIWIFSPTLFSNNFIECIRVCLGLLKINDKSNIIVLWKY